MPRLYIFITAIVLFHSTCSLAYTPLEGNITSNFGPYLYKTNFTGSSTGAKSPELLGMGLVVNGDINSKGSLEIGMFGMNKAYFREDRSKFIAEQTNLVHIIMGYRRWINEYLSASLTFFSDYSMGDPQIIHNDFAPSTEVDTSARDTTEYGFDLAVQAELYHTPQFDVVADARYSLSVTAKENEKADHFGIMLGLRYIYQEKHSRNKSAD